MALTITLNQQYLNHPLGAYDTEVQKAQVRCLQSTESENVCLIVESGPVWMNVSRKRKKWR